MNYLIVNARKALTFQLRINNNLAKRLHESASEFCVGRVANTSPFLTRGAVETSKRFNHPGRRIDIGSFGLSRALRLPFPSAESQLSLSINDLSRLLRMTMTSMKYSKYAHGQPNLK